MYLNILHKIYLKFLFRQVYTSRRQYYIFCAHFKSFLAFTTTLPMRGKHLKVEKNLKHLGKFENFHNLVSETQRHKGQKCLGCPDNGFGWRQNHKAWWLTSVSGNDVFPLGHPLSTKLIHGNSFHHIPPFRNNYCASTWKFPHLDIQDHPLNQQDTVLPDELVYSMHMSNSSDQDSKTVKTILRKYCWVLKMF